MQIANPIIPTVDAIYLATDLYLIIVMRILDVPGFHTNQIFSKNPQSLFTSFFLV